MSMTFWFASSEKEQKSEEYFLLWKPADGLTSGLRFHRRRVGKVTAKHAVTSKPSLLRLQGRIQPLRRTTFTQFSLSGLVSTRKTLPISRCISCQRPCCRLLSLRDHFSCMCQPPTRRLGLFWHSFWHTNPQERKSNLFSYLSKTLRHYERNYSPIEKHCLAVVWAAQKLRHDFNTLWSFSREWILWTLKNPRMATSVVW